MEKLMNPLYAVILTVLGFLVFRLLLSEEAPDYATEISAAVFGGLITIVITGVLLQKQSDVDMRKDRNAKMLEAKLALYEKLMEEVGRILSGTGGGSPDEADGKKTDIMDHLVAVQVLNQRLAVLGNDKVVERFSAFASKFAEAARLAKGRKGQLLTAAEKDGMLAALGEMSVEMRLDVISEEERKEYDNPKVLDAFRESVISNTNTLRNQLTTEKSFLGSCDEDDRQYFTDLLRFLKDNGFGVNWRTVGFSVSLPDDGGAILHGFPTGHAKKLVLLRDNVPAGMDIGLITRKKAARSGGPGADEADAKQIGFTTDVAVSDLYNLLASIAEKAKQSA